MTGNSNTFTGRQRDRKTKPIVKISDAFARVFITMGGMGTILAVSTVFIFLFYVAAPLFFPAKIDNSSSRPFPYSETGSKLVHLSVDEYQTIGWAFFADGSIAVFRCDTGERLGEIKRPFEQRQLLAWNFNTDSDDVYFGFEDGTAQLGRIGVDVSFLSENQVPEEILDIPLNSMEIHQDGIYVRTRAQQFRLHRFNVSLEEPYQLTNAPIELIGHTITGSGQLVVALTEGKLSINSVRQTRNLLTGAVTPQLRQAELVYENHNPDSKPEYLLVSELGNTVYLAWKDGKLSRFDTRNLNDPRFVETLYLTEDENASLTSLEFLIGKTTLISGDSEGNIKAWFCVPDEYKLDLVTLAQTHNLGNVGTAVTALSGSARSRLLAVGLADGRAKMFYVTSNRMLAEAYAAGGEQNREVTAVALGAREDSLYAATSESITSWDLDLKHPAINLNSLFGKVWYEDYSEPQYTWQSSAGVDDFEPKYSLTPLIFGTIKATFYSMLFGLPIALLAAIYSSEFLHPKIKLRIKPLIEMMASLPSVVLGFLAALVIAPFIEDVVPTTLASFATIPFAFLVGAYIWQMLPRNFTTRFKSFRIIVICIMIPFGLFLAVILGPAVERILFAGDLRRWLNGQIGTGLGGWFIILLPLSAITVIAFIEYFARKYIRKISDNWSAKAAAVYDFCKFVFAILVSLAVAALAGWVLTKVGFDPRGEEPYHFIGTYVQRNAMVVGFIMGFAIIPIIYTLADDALSSVPDHLRSASLGAGATPWQTAIRIIVPTAMSGLFSAAMIGLGRAVGETMIVLMAAGNTPVMQMNIFNGFRTLSANIAVELPEAPVGGTHYRVLFLAALSLFIMTFIINTIAEIVRLRFRKRAYKL